MYIKLLHLDGRSEETHEYETNLKNKTCITMIA